LNEVLFTPWRLAYLIGTDTPRDEGCVFCGLPARTDEESLIIHRGVLAYVVLNRFPYTNGHLMVIPFGHHATLGAMTVEERAELIELGAAAEAALRAEYHPHGMNLGLNLGRSAGAGIADHAHLHVVPRWDGDTNFFTVVSGTRTVPEDLSATRSRLAARFGAR
jgi:ATP adenylyltransferase